VHAVLIAVKLVEMFSTRSIFPQRSQRPTATHCSRFKPLRRIAQKPIHFHQFCLKRGVKPNGKAIVNDQQIKSYRSIRINSFRLPSYRWFRGNTLIVANTPTKATKKRLPNGRRFTREGSHPK
jgi:hypothetical protein